MFAKTNSILKFKKSEQQHMSDHSKAPCTILFLVVLYKKLKDYPSGYKTSRSTLFFLRPLTSYKNNNNGTLISIKVGTTKKKTEAKSLSATPNSPSFTVMTLQPCKSLLLQGDRAYHGDRPVEQHNWVPGWVGNRINPDMDRKVFLLTEALISHAHRNVPLIIPDSNQSSLRSKTFLAS